MGTQVRGVPEAASLSGGEPDAGSSIGRYLACQRELRGISLEELAALTKIPRRSLERLESGAFDREPDGFARGFVRTVAAALGLDPDEAVMRLLREPPDEDEQAGPLRATRWLAAALALLALLAVGAALWRGEPRDRSAPTVAAPDAQPVVRRDPVRSLAEATRPPPGGEAPRAPDPPTP